MSKLIIIRGNSGSGKTTVARELRQRLGDGLSDDTMVVSQDVIRRDILRERDTLQKRSVIDLTEIIVEFGRKQGRVIILEGIFSSKKYRTMLLGLMKKFDKAYVYYFDLPFEETLRRHATKLNAHEFGEELMREWWNKEDYLGVSSEKALNQELSVESIVNQILADIDDA